ncbi:hypothetical protein ACFFX0_11035 [Citricoccus parietis]|uniref:Uncharacterized protein n=1 Tax=Citricoccus parietis TaxID=592307 RepID=A0ABV5FYG5_9MICC
MPSTQVPPRTVHLKRLLRHGWRADNLGKSTSICLLVIILRIASGPVLDQATRTACSADRPSVLWWFHPPECGRATCPVRWRIPWSTRESATLPDTFCDS